MPELTLGNLANGLEMFSQRYQALDVFVADLVELRSLANGEPVSGLREVDSSALAFEHEGRWYRLQVFTEEGVARLTRYEGQPPSPPVGAGSLAAGALGAALGAGLSSKRAAAEGALAGLVLGLLIGSALEAASSSAEPPRRVFTICFDANQKQWRAYDGGLVGWMKSALAPPRVLADMPR